MSRKKTAIFAAVIGLLVSTLISQAAQAKQEFTVQDEARAAAGEMDARYVDRKVAEGWPIGGNLRASYHSNAAVGFVLTTTTMKEAVRPGKWPRQEKRVMAPVKVTKKITAGEAVELLAKGLPEATSIKAVSEFRRTGDDPKLLGKLDRKIKTVGDFVRYARGPYTTLVKFATAHAPKWERSLQHVERPSEEMRVANDMDFRYLVREVGLGQATTTYSEEGVWPYVKFTTKKTNLGKKVVGAQRLRQEGKVISKPVEATERITAAKAVKILKSGKGTVVATTAIRYNSQSPFGSGSRKAGEGTPVVLRNLQDFHRFANNTYSTLVKEKVGYRPPKGRW